MSRQQGPKARTCGCKGIRRCRLCMTSDDSIEPISKTIYEHCVLCQKAWLLQNDISAQQGEGDREGDTSLQQGNGDTCISLQQGNGDTCISLQQGKFDTAQQQGKGDTSQQQEKCGTSSQDTQVITSLQHKPDSSVKTTDSNPDLLAIDCHTLTEQHKTLSLTDSKSKPIDSEPDSNNLILTSASDPENGSVFQHSSSSSLKEQPICRHGCGGQAINFEGIVILENFISSEEECFLSNCICDTEFVNSQSGRRKQDYGPKVNFKKQKLRVAEFKGLPSYSRFLYERMKNHLSLHDFEPVELCNLEYSCSRGAHIEAHFDDFWLWGERLVTLNLLSDSVLTFSDDPNNPGIVVRVPLSRRSLIIVSSAARYKWKHAILPQDIHEKRLAMTFRELSLEFMAGGVKEQEGAELQKLALTFEGRAVGC